MGETQVNFTHKVYLLTLAGYFNKNFYSANKLHYLWQNILLNKNTSFLLRQSIGAKPTFVSELFWLQNKALLWGGVTIREANPRFNPTYNTLSSQPTKCLSKDNVQHVLRTQRLPYARFKKRQTAHSLTFWAAYSLLKLNLLKSLSTRLFATLVSEQRRVDFGCVPYLSFARLLYYGLDFGDNGIRLYYVNAYSIIRNEFFDSTFGRVGRSHYNILHDYFFILNPDWLIPHYQSNFSYYQDKTAVTALNSGFFEKNYISFSFVFKFKSNVERKTNLSRLKLRLLNLYQTAVLGPNFNTQTKSLLSNTLARRAFINPSPRWLPSVSNYPHLVVENSKAPHLQLTKTQAFSAVQSSLFLLSNITFFKLTLYTTKNKLFPVRSFYKTVQLHWTNFFLYDRTSPKSHANFLPSPHFSLTIRKIFVKVFSYHRFTILVTPWYYHTLIRFLESCSGRKAFFKVHSKLTSVLTIAEKARCLIWSHKVRNFRKSLGPRLFLNESMQILYTALKLKDPYFLSGWMVSMFQKISFWKYKTFLRYFKYILRYFFWSFFTEMGITGVKMQLKGKISVAGNARTRTILQRTGQTGHATFHNRVLSQLSLVRTFTGVQGFKLWIFF